MLFQSFQCVQRAPLNQLKKKCLGFTNNQGRLEIRPNVTQTPHLVGIYSFGSRDVQGDRTEDEQGDEKTPEGDGDPHRGVPRGFGPVLLRWLKLPALDFARLGFCWVISGLNSGWIGREAEEENKGLGHGGRLPFLERKSRFGSRCFATRYTWPSGGSSSELDQ